VKKSKKTESKEESKEDDELSSLKPSVYDTLPFQLYELAKQAPELPGYVKEMWDDWRLRREEAAKEAEAEEEEKRLWKEKQEARKAARKRVTGENN